MKHTHKELTVILSELRADNGLTSIIEALADVVAYDRLTDMARNDRDFYVITCRDERVLRDALKLVSAPLHK